jgi:hypothetical protein
MTRTFKRKNVIGQDVVDAVQGMHSVTATKGLSIVESRRTS